MTGYRAIASPGESTCSTTGATTCVLGGAAGKAYTVTVVALSAGGESPASAASESVTPTAPALSATPPDTDLPLDTGDGAISTAAPGQEIVMIGDGYAPFSTVTIAIYSDPIVLANITADAVGGFEQAVTVPDGFSGDHSFVAAGVDPDGNFRALRLDVTVAADANGDDPADPSLPTTGAAIIWLLVAGLGLTLMGFALRAVRS